MGHDESSFECVHCTALKWKPAAKKERKVSQWIYIFFFGVSNVKFFSLLSFFSHHSVCDSKGGGKKGFHSVIQNQGRRCAWCGKNDTWSPLQQRKKAPFPNDDICFYSPASSASAFLVALSPAKNFTVTTKLLFHFRWIIASAAKDNLKMGDKSEAISRWRTFFSPPAMIFACYTRHSDKLHQSGWIHFHFPTCAKINNFPPGRPPKSEKAFYCGFSRNTRRNVGVIIWCSPLATHRLVN